MKSTVRRAERTDRSSRHSLAPARNGAGSTAPAANAFASLEHEATQIARTSPELLEIAREGASRMVGATKVYEVPPELLEIARESRRKRAAAQLARMQADAASSPPEAAAAETIPPAAPPAPEPESAVVPRAELDDDAGPELCVTETDLSVASVEEVLGLSQAPEPTPAAVIEPDVTPDFRGRAARTRVARRILTALCLIAVCAASAWGGKLLLDRYAASLPVIGGRL